MTTAAVAETASSTVRGTIPDTHEWVGAATVVLTLAQARHADIRGSFRAPEQTRIDVLEIYCKNCRRPYEDVHGNPCAAAENKDHLIGGPTGIRAKRTGHTVPGHDCAALGCNTGIALSAQRAQEARRNGMAPDTRKARALTAVSTAAPPPVAAPAVPVPAVVVVNPLVPPRKRPAAALAPGALTLW